MCNSGGPAISAFMFATGIENSIPTIKGGTHRVDQMESCGHYRHWRKDFDLVEEMGLRFLRYGPPLHTSFVAPGKYDFSDYDRIDDFDLNEILWRAIKGKDAPLPPPVRRAIANRTKLR